MKSLIAFNIPIYGIKPGMHQYEFRVEKPFFEQFPSELINDGCFDVKIDLDKRSDMLVLDFDIKGTQRTTCDRCLEIIDLPVADKQQLIFKFVEEVPEETEIVYLPKDTKQLNLARYIHESVCFALPLIKVYDCEDEVARPCNDEILKILNQEDSDQDANESNPLWDELNKLNQSSED